MINTAKAAVFLVLVKDVNSHVEVPIRVKVALKVNS